jgi:predicted nucleotidyltransferase
VLPNKNGNELTNLDQEALNQVCEAFREHSILFAILFGSRVSNAVHPESDYDFAVFLGTKDPKAQYETKKKLSALLPPILATNVDVIILDKTDLDLAFKALSEGKIIFEISSEARQGFVEYVITHYPDYHIFQEKFLNDYRKGASIRAKLENSGGFKSITVNE